ncbi:Protein of unknown function [Shimia gijangensis]|uniref:Lysozyme inhibitor LprI-like N-terminal domain-containing protein n=1 Tax=Shimia gijangensis TaxID=1470563 RepID=A0A1M6L359_9RHOB|nr:lysozyme inhibitor LprI family protein [Shimia gijangensis]SHJ65630.1 Protein of unknown function [Shimia gijangensis]
MLGASALCLGAVICTTASAQELQFSPYGTEHCIEEQRHIGDPMDCVGESANICMNESEGGFSTVGMGGCYDKELQYWDGRLNAAYKRVRRDAKEIDAEMKELGSAAPSQAEALLAMQRAWIVFRDAKCDFERAQWGGGTGGGPATVSCHMVLTAEQALFLEETGLEH